MAMIYMRNGTGIIALVLSLCSSRGLPVEQAARTQRRKTNDGAL